MTDETDSVEKHLIVTPDPLETRRRMTQFSTNSKGEDFSEELLQQVLGIEKSQVQVLTEIPEGFKQDDFWAIQVHSGTFDTKPHFFEFEAVISGHGGSSENGERLKKAVFYIPTNTLSGGNQFAGQFFYLDPEKGWMRQSMSNDYSPEEFINSFSIRPSNY